MDRGVGQLLWPPGVGQVMSIVPSYYRYLAIQTQSKAAGYYCKVNENALQNVFRSCFQFDPTSNCQQTNSVY